MRIITIGSIFLTIVQCEEGKTYEKLENKPPEEIAGEKELEEMLTYLRNHPEKNGFGINNLYFLATINKNGFAPYIYKTKYGWEKSFRKVGVFKEGDHIALKNTQRHGMMA